jgi:hypothetical protein
MLAHRSSTHSLSNRAGGHLRRPSPGSRPGIDSVQQLVERERADHDREDQRNPFVGHNFPRCATCTTAMRPNATPVVARPCGAAPDLARTDALGLAPHRALRSSMVRSSRTASGPVRSSGLRHRRSRRGLRAPSGQPAVAARVFAQAIARCMRVGGRDRFGGDGEITPLTRRSYFR